MPPNTPPSKIVELAGFAGNDYTNAWSENRNYTGEISFVSPVTTCSRCHKATRLHIHHYGIVATVWLCPVCGHLTPLADDTTPAAIFPTA